MKNLLIIITIIGAIFYEYQNEVQAKVISKTDCDTTLISLEMFRNNIVYMGIGNYLKINGLSNPHKELEVIGEGVEITKGEKNTYIVRADKPGRGTIIIKFNDFEKRYSVRINRIPRPWVLLGNKESGEIGKGEFKAQGGLGAWITNFDIDGKCKMISFQMTRITKSGEQETLECEGGRFDDKARVIINKAETGDIYLFEELRYRCPGDKFEKGRKDVNSLVFRIK